MLGPLLLSGVYAAVCWYGAHELFYPPGDWIGALLASLFLSLGIGGIRLQKALRLIEC